ncbi:tigger transposable element-derived protein 6-like [Dysidea avara]|uniref:tigger transposable element-derived protein 6-like n=1 Tax=Dysidea avara TaxID=196820 RepID=UPI00331B3E96
MTGKILLSVLRKLNQRLSDKSRKIGLFMDNAGYHPEDIKDSLNNIKSIFLPANTTLMLQPLDLGIIKNFKVHYRTHLLRFVISKIETCTTASEVTKSINILHAIRWVAQAWEAVKPKMCFRKGGVLDESFAVPSCPCEKSDAFKDEDEVDTSEMHNLIGQLGPAEGEQWEEQLFSSIDPTHSPSSCIESEGEPEIKPPPPKLRNLGEADHWTVTGRLDDPMVTEMVTSSGDVTVLVAFPIRAITGGAAWDKM